MSDEKQQSASVGNGWVIFAAVALFVGGFVSHYAFHEDHDFDADQRQDVQQHTAVVERHDSHDKQFEVLGKILVRLEGKIDAVSQRVSDVHDHVAPRRPLRGVESEVQPAGGQ